MYKKIDASVNIFFITAYDLDNEILEQINMLFSQDKDRDIIIRKPIEIYKLGDLINKKIDSSKYFK
ncbi:MAG TPA: hypothetical protein VN704_03195 [Verrucomicrobiae bacterium]|nr:hypothetical protein [Verrucomicrobiae bacterium]